MKEQKNQKKIVFFLIIIITLFLYYKIRINEEFNENLIESQTEINLSKDKLLKGQMEENIHLNNSKLLNTKINVEDIKKLIIKEQSEKENIIKNNIETSQNELLYIETFFLSLFCIIIGGLYFYSSNKENKKKYKSFKEKYLNENKDYYLAESEMEFLINKGEIENNYNMLDDE